MRACKKPGNNTYCTGVHSRKDIRSEAIWTMFFNRCDILLSLLGLTAKVLLPRAWVQHSSSTSRMVGMGLPVGLYWLTWLATCEFMGLIWMFRGKAFSGSSVNHVFSVRWLHNERGNNKTNDNKTTTKGQEKKKKRREEIYPHEFQIIIRLPDILL